VEKFGQNWTQPVRDADAPQGTKHPHIWACGQRIRAKAAEQGLKLSDIYAGVLKRHPDFGLDISIYYKILKGARGRRWVTLFGYIAEFLAEPDTSKTPSSAVVDQVRSLIFDKAHVTALEVPSFSWMKSLVEHVSRYEWTCVRALPSNGAELVAGNLEDRFPDARIIPIDLGGLGRNQTILNVLSAAITISTVSPSGGVPSHAGVVRAVAEGKRFLIIVISGAGGHVRLFGPKSLRRIALEVQGFRNVASPRVVVAVVSITSFRHLMSGVQEGTLLALTPIFPSCNDAEIATAWAAERLGTLPAGERTEILRAGRGRLGPLQAAIRALGQPQPDRLQAIQRAHRTTGELILDQVGPCCGQVLMGKSRANGCIRELADSLVLRADESSPQALIEIWDTVWRPFGVRSR
jgi:hypothetical protein